MVRSAGWNGGDDERMVQRFGVRVACCEDMEKRRLARESAALRPLRAARGGRPTDRFCTARLRSLPTRNAATRWAGTTSRLPV